MALSTDQRYLYALNNRTGTALVSGFRVQADGSLTPAGGAGGLIPGATGLAAR